MPDIRDITLLLQERYGEAVRPELRPDPVDELVQTILSQNTSDVNTARAFASLKRAFPNWQEVIDANTADVVAAIHVGGLANQKGPRIQRVLRQILEKRGSLDLTFLEEMPVNEAQRWLTSLPGVGPKTAACVLLFSLDRPVMPVDTHVHRVGMRLGLISPDTTTDQAHAIIGAGLTVGETYQAHMLLIRHGRETCKARNPRCAECVLNDMCPSAQVTPN